MNFTALQQSSEFTAALCKMGVAAGHNPASGIHYITRGPVAFASRVTDTADLGEFRRQMGRRVCIVNHHTRPSGQGFCRIMSPASIGIIDLARPLRLHPKARNALRQSVRHRMTVRHRPYDQIKDAWLMDEDTAQQKRKGFRALPHDVIGHWPKDQTRVFTASLHGTNFASMVFIIHSQCVTYQLGWSSQIGRSLNAHQLLLHQAAEYFADRGCLGIDLGTVDSVNAPGLARFKCRSGATVHRLGGTWAALPAWRS